MFVPKSALHRYARERTMEQPLSQVASASAAIVPEFPEAKTMSPRKGAKNGTVTTQDIAGTNGHASPTTAFDEEMRINGGAGEHLCAPAGGSKTPREVGNAHTYTQTEYMPTLTTAIARTHISLFVSSMNRA